MKPLLYVALSVCIGLLPAADAWGQGYGNDARVAHIRTSLDAVSSTNSKTLENAYSYIDVAERNRCRSSFRRLRVNCLVEAAKRNCRSQRGRSAKRACRLYSDLIVTNKLSEEQFVSEREKYRIMKKHRDFRRELRSELSRRYGSLTAEFHLANRASCGATDLDCISAGINNHCLEYADTRNLSWQHCVAALTWFIGTSLESDSP